MAATPVVAGAGLPRSSLRYRTGYSETHGQVSGRQASGALIAKRDHLEATQLSPQDDPSDPYVGAVGRIEEGPDSLRSSQSTMLAIIMGRSSCESFRVVWPHEAPRRLKRDQEEPKSDNHTPSAHVSRELRGSRPSPPVSSSSDGEITVYMNDGTETPVELLASPNVLERKLPNGTIFIGSITLKSLQLLEVFIAVEAARNQDRVKRQKQPRAKID